MVSASMDKTFVQTLDDPFNKVKSLEKKSVRCSKEHMKCEASEWPANIRSLVKPSIKTMQ